MFKIASETEKSGTKEKRKQVSSTHANKTLKVKKTNSSETQKVNRNLGTEIELGVNSK